MPRLLTLLLLALRLTAAEPPVDPRIPASARLDWQKWMNKSTEAQREQEAVLNAELRAAGLSRPVRAPAGYSFKFEAKKPPGDSFASVEARHLALTICTWQLPCGGWSKAIDYRKGPRQQGMQWTSQSSPWHYAATIAAIEGALAWFASTQLPGEKAGDPPFWARFYDLTTHVTIFPGKKDHKIYTDYTAMRVHNPGGYDYFTTQPADLIGPRAERWRRQLNKAPAAQED